MANKERVRLLVDALRSGEYVQGRGYLETRHPSGVRHCCLGVACRVAMANGLELIVNTDPENYYTAFDGESAVLPEAVRLWYGLRDYNPFLGLMGTFAASANDEGNMFDIIAAAFEDAYLSDD